MTSIHDISYEDIKEFLLANNKNFKNEDEAYNVALILLKDKKSKGHTISIIEWMMAYNLLISKANISNYTSSEIDNMNQFQIDKLVKLLTMNGNNRENIKNILKYLHKLDNNILIPEINEFILQNLNELDVNDINFENLENFSESEIEINFEFNNVYPIKSNIDPQWTLGEKLNDRDSNIEIRIVCLRGDCKYIAKVIPINEKFAYCGIAEKDRVRNELVISKQMSEVNIAPTIYDMSLSDMEAIIIMKRYDGTLTDLLYLYQTDKNIPMNKIIQLIEQLVNKMHQLGIIHRDLHSDNILYTKDNLFAIIDYDSGIRSTSEQLREIDKKELRKIISVYDRINNGEIFRNRNEILGIEEEIEEEIEEDIPINF